MIDLNVQEYNLDPSMDSMDNATQANLENLAKVGVSLLSQPVLKMNIDTNVPEEKTNQGTNDEALERLAETLYKEKQLRLKKKLIMEKLGRPLLETITFPFATTS